MRLIILLYILLVAILAIHLIEEIRTGFRVKFPFGEIPKPAFICINIGVYTYSILTLSLALFHINISLPLIWGFAVIQTLNVIGHIGFMAREKGYFPGGYSTVPLLLIDICLIYQLIIY